MITYNDFKLLNNKQKIALIKMYNNRYFPKFTIGEDETTITINNEFKDCLTKSIGELTCMDFQKPFTAIDFVEYYKYIEQGLCDEEACYRAICD